MLALSSFFLISHYKFVRVLLFKFHTEMLRKMKKKLIKVKNVTNIKI